MLFHPHIGSYFILLSDHDFIGRSRISKRYIGSNLAQVIVANFTRE